MNKITKLINRTLMAASVVGVASCASTDTPILSNKDKAIAVISSIETGDAKAIGYINPEKYIQHNLSVADGLAGFGAVMQQLPQGSAKAQVKRAFQDGDYVVLHTEYNFFGPKAGFDIFRFESGKIVEHWDNLQAIAPANASGRTQFDGTTQITDLDKTAQNKAIVADMIESIFIKGDMAKIGQFIDAKDSDYLQHNPHVADGLTGLGKALTALAEQGMPMIYKTNHKVLGQGNFVLAVSEGVFMNKDVAFYDLFRLANGKVVEHWDTIEEILPRSAWQNNNGKFNF
ncbi:nuclear transport factor 2 family protein [Thalassotalea sp. PLHSN55]|uniref:nuclear transport factor 2 family protein n=1 Tax=Thalassotalea sp. PLHSN55 TaxID=3435888 RepID=UPI003F827996